MGANTRVPLHGQYANDDIDPLSTGREFTCEWDLQGVIHMLEVSSDYPRFALLTLRRKVDEISSSDELAGEISPDGQWIDVIIGILAIQGHSRVRAHPYLFGWKRLYWRECPILFHQSEAANHEHCQLWTISRRS